MINFQICNTVRLASLLNPLKASTCTKNALRLLILVTFAIGLTAADEDASLKRAQKEDSTLLKPMDTEGIPSRLKNILNGYYNNSLGGQENWSRIQSLSIKGEIISNDGKSFEFTNYRKKPNFNKFIIFLSNKYKLVSSYNGKEAWMQLEHDSTDPVQKEFENLEEFIRDSRFRSPLLYPSEKNKTIEIIGNSEIDGVLCVQIEVIQSDGNCYHVFLDSRRYQRAEHITDKSGKKVRSTIQSDFRNISGLIVPFEIRNYINGKLAEKIILKSAEINEGLVPWFFEQSK